MQKAAFCVIHFSTAHIYVATCCTCLCFPCVFLLLVVIWVTWPVAAGSQGDSGAMTTGAPAGSLAAPGSNALSSYTRAVTIYSSKLGGPGVGALRHRPMSASMARAKGIPYFWPHTYLHCVYDTWHI